MSEKLEDKCIWKIIVDRDPYDFKSNIVKTCAGCSGYDKTCPDYKPKSLYTKYS